jgi:hypothetical protein
MQSSHNRYYCNGEVETPVDPKTIGELINCIIHDKINNIMTRLNQLTIKNSKNRAYHWLLQLRQNKEGKQWGRQKMTSDKATTTTKSTITITKILQSGERLWRPINKEKESPVQSEITTGKFCLSNDGTTRVQRSCRHRRQHYDQKIMHAVESEYGFLSKPTGSTCTNAIWYIYKTLAWLYYIQPSNL